MLQAETCDQEHRTLSYPILSYLSHNGQSQNVHQNAAGSELYLSGNYVWWLCIMFPLNWAIICIGGCLVITVFRIQEIWQVDCTIASARPPTSNRLTSSWRLAVGRWGRGKWMWQMIGVDCGWLAMQCDQFTHIWWSWSVDQLMICLRHYDHLCNHQIFSCDPGNVRVYWWVLAVIGAPHPSS